MIRSRLFSVRVILVAGAALQLGFGADEKPRAPASSQRAHTQERFTFIARASLPQVAPLFGADKERLWSPQWHPQFISPLPAADMEGMVFTVRHGDLQATWVSTDFDLKNGRIQYVYVIPDALITVITLKLTPKGNQTNVDVKYDRTALTEQADSRVLHLAEKDRAAGPDWESQINSYLAKLVR